MKWKYTFDYRYILKGYFKEKNGQSPVGQDNLGLGMRGHVVGPVFNHLLGNSACNNAFVLGATSVIYLGRWYIIQYSLANIVWVGGGDGAIPLINLKSIIFIIFLKK